MVTFTLPNRSGGHVSHVKVTTHRSAVVPGLRYGMHSLDLDGVDVGWIMIDLVRHGRVHHVLGGSLRVGVPVERDLFD